MAYNFANKFGLPLFKDMVTSEINKLTFDKVSDVMTAAHGLGTKNISHLILPISTESHHMRHTITIPPHMLHIHSTL